MAHNIPIMVELELRRDGCVIANTASELTLRTEILAVKENKTLHRITGDFDRDKLKEYLRPHHVEITESGDNSMWVQSSNCEVCKFFSRTEHAALLGTTINGRYLLSIRLLLPSKSKLLAISNLLRMEGIDFTVVKEEPYRHQVLTPRERQILESAFKAGYFEIDGRASLSQLATNFNISPSSLSETMRRGLRKIVEFYLFNQR